MSTVSVSKDPESVHVELEVSLDEPGSIMDLLEQWGKKQTDIFEVRLKTGCEQRLEKEHGRNQDRARRLIEMLSGGGTSEPAG